MNEYYSDVFGHDKERVEATGVILIIDRALHWQGLLFAVCFTANNLLMRLSQAESYCLDTGGGEGPGSLRVLSPLNMHWKPSDFASSAQWLDKA